MPLKPLDPVLTTPLCAGWDIAATESGRSTNGLKANLTLSNGVAKYYKTFELGDTDAQEALATRYAAVTGQSIEGILETLVQFIMKVESATRTRDARPGPTPKEQDYEQDGDGLWLVTHDDRGDERRQLTNFGCRITADIVEDDGTPETRRFFELEAHCGTTSATVRVAAKDFHTMAWVPETLGAKAHVIPGSFHKDHAATAIQDLSDEIETRHTFVHTGWRGLEGTWHYLHGAGAIHAGGAATDVLVSLSDTLARYQLPDPPEGKERVAALTASLKLRAVAPADVMIPILATAYLAPLCPLLGGEPPDFTTWVVGPSGQFKSEDAALALAHYGDFTRLTLPATFVATGNGLERLCHTLKDALLVVDDFYPAGDRRQAEAMQQTAGRLLRSMGNRSSRQRMRHDTTQRSDLPPRCLVLATGERLPEGHSTNARIFLVTVPKLGDEDKKPWADKLSAAQADRGKLPFAMAAYLQWIATHWDTLRQEVPECFHALRTAAYQEGNHAREPSQVAYLQTAWQVFTRCAVDAGALTAEDQQAILTETQASLLGLAGEHSQILAAETTVSRFLALLSDGFASKAIYVRTPEDADPPDASQWGWTPAQHYNTKKEADETTFEPRQATLVGYLDADYLFLLPEALYRYLQQASQKAGRAWPVDSSTLRRELHDAELIEVQKDSDGRTHRTKKKKINGVGGRYLWLKRTMFRKACGDDDPTPAREKLHMEADDDIPF